MANKTFQDTSQRIETKYIISMDQLVDLLTAFEGHLQEDQHARSTIANLYYDTPTYQIIRESFDNPHFKEKLRLRSYDAYPAKTSQVFIEIKQKIGQVVHKRRTASSLLEAEKCLAGKDCQIEDVQLKDQLEHLYQQYEQVRPMMYIYYNRYSLKGIDEPQLRITIDHDVTYRQTDLTLLAGCHGDNLLEDNQAIMEIKTEGAYPAWLTEILEENDIQSSAFSKYGVAYQKATGDHAKDKYANPAIS